MTWIQPYWDGAITAFPPVAGVVGGYLAHTLQKRLRPYSAIRAFGTGHEAVAMIQVPKALEELADLVAFTGVLVSGPVPQHHLQQTRVVLRDWVKNAAEGIKALEGSIGEIDATTNPKDTFQAAIKLLALREPATFLDFCLSRGTVTPPAPAANAPALCSFSYRQDERDGCFLVDGGGFCIYFGTGLTQSDNWRTNVQAFVEVLVRGQKVELVALLRQLLPRIRSTLADADKFIEGLAKLLQPYDKWHGLFYVANLGPSPMLVMTDKALLIVTNKETKTAINIEGELRMPHPQGKGWLPPPGPVLLPGGSNAMLGFFSKETQEKMRNGGLLRSVWDSKKGTALIEFSIRGSEIPWRRGVKTPWAHFKESASA